VRRARVLGAAEAVSAEAAADNGEDALAEHAEDGLGGHAAAGGRRGGWRCGGHGTGARAGERDRSHIAADADAAEDGARGAAGEVLLPSASSLRRLNEILTRLRR